MQLRREAEIAAAAERAMADLKATGLTVGQLPTVVNIIVYQGDDFYLRVTVNPGSSLVDLTTYTAKAEIRQTPGAPTVIASFDATIVDPITIMLHLTAEQSRLVAAAASWDVQVTDPTGTITTLAYGAITPTRDVTREGATTS